ncbi:hypothetical protein CTAYLR_001661 [Chrysophaeum taylorii]|uniref:JmjC domain-containing protein n=1 Tax=Chrysophaeum taylorii TaxID=2483200 RepID=A0AAD7UCV5_9STRA|nr:hypothetical protein CTAYLR_001661 [Chrysophaeum taylorii]
MGGSCSLERVRVEEALEWRRPPARPFILEGFEVNTGFANSTRPEVLRSSRGSLKVKLTSSNSYSQGERVASLAEYLEERPRELANESWYLFGPETSLVEGYSVPRCGGRWCDADLVASSFGVGRRGSGVSFHTHGAGFSQVLHGRKRWFFFETRPPRFDPDVSTAAWVETVLPGLWMNKPPIDCVLERPTDLLYFPRDWWHATLNLDDINVFVSTFVADDAAAAWPFFSSPPSL